MRVGTFVCLLPAEFPVPRTMPGICKMLRKHKQSIFPCRALGTKGQMDFSPPGRAHGLAHDVYTGLERLHNADCPTLGNFLSHGINILKSIFPFSLLGCQLSLKIAQNCKQDGKLRSFSRRAGIWLDSTSPSQHGALHTSPHSFQLVVLAEKPLVPLIQYKNHILQVRWLSSKSKVIPQVKQLREAVIRPVFRSSDSQPRARGSY